MIVHMLHRGCGGIIEIDLRRYGQTVLYTAACEKCGQTREARTTNRKFEREEAQQK